VREWAWGSTDQLLELLGVLRSLGDQVRTVVLPEPAQLQLQVLVDRPVQMKVARATGEHRFEVRAAGWWQARVLDVEQCVTALSSVRELDLNLRLTDPLELPGSSGDWVLHLGARSHARRGHDDGLPTLHADVNAFTRLWLGVRPATTLSATDDLVASDALLAALDDAIRLPRPDVQMAF
jgi:predicted acetyltransferase